MSLRFCRSRSCVPPRKILEMRTATQSLLTRIQFVAIPSTDQDRSLAFYEELGFDKRHDVPWGNGHRWIELCPPNAPTGIALVPPTRDDPTSLQTGVVFNTGNIHVAHAELRELGVDVDESVARVGASQDSHRRG